MKEEWKKLTNYPGYSISSEARVRRDAFIGTTEKTYLRENGKPRVRIYKLEKKERILKRQKGTHVMLWINGCYFLEYAEILRDKYFGMK